MCVILCVILCVVLCVVQVKLAGWSLRDKTHYEVTYPFHFRPFGTNKVDVSQLSTQLATLDSGTTYSYAE